MDYEKCDNTFRDQILRDKFPADIEGPKYDQKRISQKNSHIKTPLYTLNGLNFRLPHNAI